MRNKANKVKTIEAPKEVWDKLKNLAIKRGDSVTNLVRIAILKYLEKEYLV